MVNSSSSLAISCATSPKTRGFVKSYNKFSGIGPSERLESPPTAATNAIGEPAYALRQTTHFRRHTGPRFDRNDLLRLVHIEKRGRLLPEDGGICSACGGGRNLLV